MTATIHNRYDTPTESEKRAADRILAAPENAVKLTAKELAARDYSALRQHLSERNEILKQMRYKMNKGVTPL